MRAGWSDRRDLGDETPAEVEQHGLRVNGRDRLRLAVVVLEEEARLRDGEPAQVYRDVSQISLRQLNSGS